MSMRPSERRAPGRSERDGLARRKPGVEKAAEGRRYTSYPRASNRSASLRAAAKSKNPLYGIRPTMGYFQV